MSHQNPVPFEPPVTFTDLPATGGRIGSTPEDFRVDEVPLYEFSGEGAHLYVKLRKRDWSSPAAVRALAKTAGVRDRDVGCAGMKDRWAVTTQWLSFPDGARPVEEWEPDAGLEILETTRHGNKLRTGHLKENRFTIRLEGCDPDAENSAEKLASAIRECGLPNYFGPQRFGAKGENLGRALAWLHHPKGPRKSQAAKFHASVLQAEVFNRYLCSRREAGLDQVFEGETVRLSGTGSVFTVTDAATDTGRFLAGDIALTGPIVGPKARAAEGPLRQLELSAIEAAGLCEESLALLARFGAGTRRDLLMTVPDLNAESTEETLTLTFTLPSGSYATQLVREFTRRPWSEPAHPKSS